MNKKNSGLAEVGKVLTVAVVAVGVLGISSAFLGDIGGLSAGGGRQPVFGLDFFGFGLPLANATDTANQPTTYVTVGNAIPLVSGNCASNPCINNGNDIILTVNATTAVYLTYAVSDNNGCADINTNIMTSTLFVATSSVSCNALNPTTDNRFCYVPVSRVTSTSPCTGTSINVTDTFWVYYYASATGAASATYGISSWWNGHVTAIDGSASTSLGTGTSSNQNVTVLTGLTVTTTTINYGSLSASSTSAVDSIATTTNAGNSTTSLLLAVQATLTKTVDSITTSSQHYATSSGVAWESGLALSAVATQVAGLALQVQTSSAVGSTTAEATFWRLRVPGGTPNGLYTGTNAFTSQWTQ